MQVKKLSGVPHQPYRHCRGRVESYVIPREKKPVNYNSGKIPVTSCPQGKEFVTLCRSSFHKKPHELFHLLLSTHRIVDSSKVAVSSITHRIAQKMQFEMQSLEGAERKGNGRASHRGIEGQELNRDTIALASSGKKQVLTVGTPSQEPFPAGNEN